MILSRGLIYSLIAAVHATPQTGYFNTQDLHVFDQPTLVNAKRVDPLGPNPAVGLGLTLFAVDTTLSDPVGNAYTTDVQSTGFVVHIDSQLGKIFYAEAAWFGIGGSDSNDYQIGTFELPVVWPDTYSFQNFYHVEFPSAFDGPLLPKVEVFIAGIAQSYASDWHFETYADHITFSGFTLHFNSWANTQFHGGSITWIAYSGNKQHIASGRASAAQPQNQGLVTFAPGTFQTPPRIFIALQSFDIGHSGLFEAEAYANSITKDGFVWHADA